MPAYYRGYGPHLTGRAKVKQKQRWTSNDDSGMQHLVRNDGLYTQSECGMSATGPWDVDSVGGKPRCGICKEYEDG